MTRRMARFVSVAATLVTLAALFVPAVATAFRGTPLLYVPDAPVTRSQTLMVIVDTQTTEAVLHTVVSNTSTMVSGHLAGADYNGPLWTLTPGAGAKTIYAQIEYFDQTWSQVFSQSVQLLTDQPSSMYVDFDPHSHEYSKTPDERFQASAPDHSQITIANSKWTVQFWRTSGAVFTPGTYQLGDDTSGTCIGNCLDVFTPNGNSFCGANKNGWFTINSLTFASSGPSDVISTDVDFRILCGPGTVMAGSIRYGVNGAIKALDQSVGTLSFGGVDENSSSTKTVDITNIGPADVTLGSASIADGPTFSHPELYALGEDDCSGATLHANDVCSMSVTFAPDSYGNKSAWLRIPDSTARGSRDFLLSGSGNELPANLTITRSGSLTAPGPITVTGEMTPGGVDSNCPIELYISGFPDFYPDGMSWTYISNSSENSKAATFEAPPGDYTAWASYTACGGRLGETTDPIHFTVTGDSTPPSGSFVIDDGSGMTNSQHLVLHLNASDASGITKIAVGASELPDDQNWAYFDPTTTVPIDLRDGNHTFTIRVRWRDGAANWSDPVTAQVVVDTTAPVVDPPAEVFAQGSTISSGKVSVDVPVDATDNLSGIEALALNQKTNSGAWKDVPVAPPGVTAGSVNRLLTPGNAYNFRARATDVATNTSAWSVGQSVSLKKEQESSSRIHFSSGWKTVSSSSYWGGAAKKSTTAGSTASLTFTGTAIAWVGRTGPDRGKVQILIDGKALPDLVDLYSANAHTKRVVWTYSWATKASHTVTIKVLGTSGRPTVELDSFVTAE